MIVPSKLKLPSQLHFFLREDWIESQLTKIKNAGKIDCNFQFCLKNTFESLISLAIRWLVPHIIEKIILILNFIFIIFQSLLSKRIERELSNSIIEMKDVYMFLATKTIDFCSK